MARTLISSARTNIEGFNFTSSLNFVNATDRVDLASNTSQNSSAFSYAAWIFPTGTGYRTIKGCTSTAGPQFRIEANNTLGLIKQSTAVIGYSTATLKMRVWQHVVVTYSAGGIYTFYIDTVQAGSGTNLLALTMGANQIGTQNSGSESYKGNIAQLVMTNTVMTQAEINNLYYKNILPDGVVGNYAISNNTGSTINDLSINANHGTITGATFKPNIPNIINRNIINNNLLNNGYFEKYPLLTAATNTATRWIDGSAGGSTTNDVFGWALRANAGTVSAKFDTTTKYSGSASLKLSTESTGAYLECCMYSSGGNPTKDETNRYFVGIKSSTAYTCTFKMKTNYISGAATTGAFLMIRTHTNQGGAAVTQYSSTGVTISSGWATYTLSFTSAATVSYAQIIPAIYGHQGTATLVMDAWFDEITLKPTTTVTRSAATGRTLA